MYVCPICKNCSLEKLAEKALKVGMSKEDVESAVAYAKEYEFGETGRLCLEIGYLLEWNQFVLENPGNHEAQTKRKFLFDLRALDADLMEEWFREYQMRRVEQVLEERKKAAAAKTKEEDKWNLSKKSYETLEKIADSEHLSDTEYKDLATAFNTMDRMKELVDKNYSRGRVCDEIQKAYNLSGTQREKASQLKKLMFKFHPDRNPSKIEWATRIFEIFTVMKECIDY